MNASAALLAEGLKLHQAGALARAEEIYRRILDDDPKQADAWYLLGRVGLACHRLDEAVLQLRQALTLRQDFAEAHASLGIALKGLGRFQEAVDCYRVAIALRPDYRDAHNNLGNALDRLGRHEEAVACFSQIVAQWPDYAEAHNNLGMVFKNLKNWDRAASALHEAIRLRPEFAEAHYNLGVIAAETGNDNEALACYQRALAIKPDLEAAIYASGHIIARRGDLDDAEAVFQRGVLTHPTSPELWNGLAFTLAEEGRLRESLTGYQRAIELSPGSPTIWSNFLYHLNYDPNTDSAALLEAHRRGGLVYTEKSASSTRLENREHQLGRALRVGYVSPDFRRHAVASFIEPILANHDPHRVVAFCYSDVRSGDDTTARLRPLAHSWRDVHPLDDSQLEDRIRSDEIDILVDLAGHTARNRLGVFARKPAPVQMTYLGYPGTTGISTIDFMLTDTFIDPIDRPPSSIETPIRLPGPFCCFAPPPDAAAVAPPPALAVGFLTFGSLHKLPKLNHDVIKLWSDLLIAVPNARLLLVRDRLKGKRGSDILAEFEMHGVGRDRVEIVHDWNARNHWQHYASIDLMLDVFPWCGHTTACESLWMGVPIVTLAGERRSSRMTGSVLASTGLSDWIATTPEQYVQIAARWAGDPRELAKLRLELRERVRQSATCNGPSFTRDLESAYEAIWAARSPSSIS